jgi:hypothetical protein
MRAIAASAASLILFSLASGCGSRGAAFEATSTVRAKSSITDDLLVSVRGEGAPCASNGCGFFVRELNTGANERYVSSLDLSGAVDAASAASALDAPDALVLRGYVAPSDAEGGARTFVARDVWRGMPAVVPGDADQFYTVAPAEAGDRGQPPYAERIATLVNTYERYGFDDIDVSAAALPWVDRTWLASRVAEHDAVVAASWARRSDEDIDDDEWILKASQVYVHLPDRVGPCPAPAVVPCDPGTIATFERNADRCVIQAGCVHPAYCPMYLPYCEDGYSLAMWRGRSGCAEFACDPTFVAE